MIRSDVIAQFVAFFSMWHLPGRLSTHTAGSTLYFSHPTACCLAFFWEDFNKLCCPKKTNSLHMLRLLFSGVWYIVYLHLVVWWTGCVMRKEIIFQTLPCGQGRRGLENVSVLYGRLSPRSPVGLKRPLGLKRLKQVGEIPRGGTTISRNIKTTYWQWWQGSSVPGWKPWVLILMPLKTRPDIISDEVDQMQRTWTPRSAILTV